MEKKHKRSNVHKSRYSEKERNKTEDEIMKQREKRRLWKRNARSRSSVGGGDCSVSTAYPVLSHTTGTNASCMILLTIFFPNDNAK